MTAKRFFTSKMRNLFLVGWAIAMIWMSLGNLVNFHQHRIWGKQLLSVACTTTRSKEKESATLIKISNHSGFTNLDFQNTELGLSCDFQTGQYGLLTLFDDYHNDGKPFRHFLSSHSLRGPPQV